MKVKIANQELEAYPVENYIYEVSYCGKKEFYEDIWDARDSNLYTNESSYKATITKIPFTPISEKNARRKVLFQKWGIMHLYFLDDNVKTLEQSRFFHIRVWIRQKLLPYLLDILFCYVIFRLFVIWFIKK